MRLIVHQNPDAAARGINPFDHGSLHTDLWKTEGLKQALTQYGFDVAFGGARRDEEKSRAKERIFSFRSANHRWDPKNQRPELWNIYNSRKSKGESIRVFPLSNWTELDIWQYIHLESIAIVPLYFAALRPTVERDGLLLMVDDERFRLHPGEIPEPAIDSLSHTRLLPAHRSSREQCDNRPRNHSGNALDDHLGAARSRDRSRSERLDGAEEASGIFLMTGVPAPSSYQAHELIAQDIEAYLRKHQHKSLLRFITCGSVDDGKSTLIGRLLYDSKMIFEDQLAALDGR